MQLEEQVAAGVLNRRIEVEHLVGNANLVTNNLQTTHRMWQRVNFCNIEKVLLSVGRTDQQLNP